MPTAMAPEVLADPVGVLVDLVTRRRPGLAPGVITDVVLGVAGGRVKQRRLAQTLSDRTDLLIDGRSPAPRVVGDLLIALGNAGAVNISLPVCAGCGRQLRTLQRRGQDWYCSACGPRREPCAGCGKTRPICYRDRHGGPRCAHCPPADGQDPTQLLVDIVAAVDPTIPADTVAAAALAAAGRTGQRLQLAWALQDAPELLTGQGARAPVPSVLRLIDTLCQAGAVHIRRPACPRCGRVITLVRPRDGIRLCRNCLAKSKAEPCSRCGAVREPAARDEHHRPLCPHCLITDPANQESCTGCGRRRPVNVRTPDGPLCSTCRPWPVLTCAICGKHGPCGISKATGMPWCRACQQRSARCAGCGQVRAVRGGTVDAPLCSTCTRPDPEFWRSCPTCGQPGRIHAGACARCAVDQRLRELLSDDTGQIHPQLRDLYQALTTTDRPRTVATWLDRSAAPGILRDLRAGTGPLTHHTLDALPPGKTVEHLRGVLVATGTLPARDEQMTRLEHWITRTIDDRPDPDEQQLLHRYAIWHLLRRLRHRLGDQPATHGQAVVVKQHVKGALALLDWLTAHDLTLATARQGDLDTWITSKEATHRRDAGHFVRWAQKQKLTGLELPATKWGGPTGVIDTETRWEQARWLLNDTTLNTADRVAGLLVLLYAQWPATISRLTLDHVDADDQAVRLRLGPQPVVLPEPLATLVRELLATRHGHATIGAPTTCQWLFPGGQPGQPISAYQLAQRLRQLGLHPGKSRSTALFQLATDLPAAILSRMLGIHITVAVSWQRASSGDWTNYAADVARRTPTHTGHR